jgi:hypothetical protein
VGSQHLGDIGRRNLDALATRAAVEIHLKPDDANVQSLRHPRRQI